MARVTEVVPLTAFELTAVINLGATKRLMSEGTGCERDWSCEAVERVTGTVFHTASCYSSGFEYACSVLG